MESICIRVDSDFARDVERVMKRHRYSTKTDLIREALRDKILDLERIEALAHAQSMYGASKRRTTDKQLHDARQQAFDELDRKV